MEGEEGKPALGNWLVGPWRVTCCSEEEDSIVQVFQIIKVMTMRSRIDHDSRLTTSRMNKTQRTRFYRSRSTSRVKGHALWGIIEVEHQAIGIHHDPGKSARLGELRLTHTVISLEMEASCPYLFQMTRIRINSSPNTINAIRVMGHTGESAFPGSLDGSWEAMCWSDGTASGA